MLYAKVWSSLEPGCLIFLLDQSGAMADPFGWPYQLAGGRPKCEMVANLVNAMLIDLVKINTVGPFVKARVEVDVIGYHDDVAEPVFSGSLVGKDLVSLSELNEKPSRLDMRMVKDMDDTGSIIERPVYLPVWLDARASGGAPMCAALRKAKDVAERWAVFHPASFPPVMVSIAQHSPTDQRDPVEFVRTARALTQIRTTDGEALLFVSYISDAIHDSLEYPVSESALPADDWARLLFGVSSVLPDGVRQRLLAWRRRSLAIGARAFLYNADPSAMMRALPWPD